MVSIVPVFAVLLSLLLLGNQIVTVQSTVTVNKHHGDHPVIRYGRDNLIQFGSSVTDNDLSLDLAEECVNKSRIRKRGKRGGIRQRIRARKSRPPLPTLLLSNVRSLRKQLTELQVCVKYLYEYRESCLLCFTETWLNSDIDSKNLNIDGFDTPIRTDRDSAITRKSIGGGVCVYINNRWCKDYVIRDSFCTDDIELLSLSLRPFYLPREFGHIFITVVYIHPKANSKKAAEHISEHVNKLDNLSPDAPKLILGDFNSCVLKQALPNYHQYVNCATCKDKTLDLCYRNIKQAYKSLAKPPLGDSDHNSIHLVPSYKQKLKLHKPTVKSIKVWSTDAIEQLKGCLDCTDWDMFRESCDNLNNLTDAVTEYIKFCADSVIPTKEIKVFPNNELKALLNEKKRAFCTGNTAQLKCVQKDIKHMTTR